VSAALDKEKELNGKVAIVTGLREEWSRDRREVAAEVRRSLVNYAKSAKQAESVVEKITAGGNANVSADLGDPDQARSLVNAVFEVFTH